MSETLLHIDFKVTSATNTSLALFVSHARVFYYDVIFVTCRLMQLAREQCNVPFMACQELNLQGTWPSSMVRWSGTRQRYNLRSIPSTYQVLALFSDIVDDSICPSQVEYWNQSHRIPTSDESSSANKLIAVQCILGMFVQWNVLKCGHMKVREELRTRFGHHK